jgi:hypothetical protein
MAADCVHGVLHVACIRAVSGRTGRGERLEKWKSEFLRGAMTLTSYINTHHKYFQNKLSSVEFEAQALNLVAKLMALEARAKTVASCVHPDDKFEGRKRLLLQTLAVVIPLMKAGDVVAPEIRDRLEREGQN